VSTVSRNIDRYAAIFDDPNSVSNAGLVLSATLIKRLGMEALINQWVRLGGRVGGALPGRKILTMVCAIIAGGTHIDHVGVLRAGATQAVLPFRVMAPSTIGTFLRAFTFGHVRQLDAVADRILQRVWAMGAGPAAGEALVIDVDSTIAEVHGHQKQGAAYGYTKQLGYHPLLATRAGTGEILHARMRKGSAGSARGVVRFVNELVARVRRAGADGQITLRADSGFWSWKLVDALNRHKVLWSITVAQHQAIGAVIASIPDTAWIDIDYTLGGNAQVAETNYTTGTGRRARFDSSCAAPDSPANKHNCFPTGDTTRSSPTSTSTRSQPISSTATTLWSNSRSATSKKARGSSTAHQGTTPRTPCGSTAPCSPTTCAAGPGSSVMTALP
jgi:hypothetical protein